MVDILPIPENLWFLHGVFKLIVAAIGLFLLILLAKKYREKKAKITMGLMLIFLVISLAFMFSSFDNFLGWENLGGEETWIGFGISQILNGLGNIGFFWLFIEVFKVKDKWDNKWKIIFIAYFIFELTVSFLIMSHYTLKWPQDVLISTLIHVLLTSFCYLSWYVGSTLLIKKIEEEKYKKRFQNIRNTSITFILVMITFAISNMSDTFSYFGWIAMFLMIIGLIFAYISFIQTIDK